MFKLLSAIGAYEHNPSALFCNEYFLRLKAMQEIQQLRSQISNIAGIAMRRMEPPADKQVSKQEGRDEWNDSLSSAASRPHTAG
jgi:ATP-dependent RNA helicase DHX37/DHR1